MKTAQACQVNGGHVPLFDRPICMVTLFMKSRTFAAENQGKSKK